MKKYAQYAPSFCKPFVKRSNSCGDYHSGVGIVSFICFLGLLLSPPLLFADDLPSTGDTMTDHLYDQVSGSVASTAAWLDSFFYDENYLAEENRTRLRLSLRTFTESGEGTEFKVKVSLRLSLPQLENRLQLFVSNKPDDIDTTDSAIPSPEDRDEDRSLAVGLRYYAKETEKHNLSLSGGLRYRDDSPVAYVQPRYRYFKSLSHWDLRFIEKLSWYTDTGFESRSDLQLERLFSQRLFFRTLTRLDWYEEEDGVFPQLSFLLRRPLDENRVLAFQMDNYFETEPDPGLDEWESTVFRFAYRRRVWRKWLWFEIEPQVAFRRDDDYSATPGLRLKLEGDFGKGSIPGIY